MRQRAQGRARHVLPAALLCGVTLLGAGVGTGAGAAGTRGKPAVATITRQDLSKQMAGLRSESDRVANIVLMWGCALDAAQAPGAEADPLDAAAATHALSTCRPVSPSSRAFPTSLANPGPGNFGPAISIFGSFAREGLAGRWPAPLRRTLNALQEASGGLESELGTGSTDPTWASGVRQLLVQIDSLIAQAGRQLRQAS